MGKLHELLAVEGDLQGTYRKILDETAMTFDKRAGHFLGGIKRLEMFDENAPDAPVERQELEETVHGKLDYMSESVIRYFDALLQKEATNQVAAADLIVDGVTIGKLLPATFLLGLESRLKDIRRVIEAAPTLPPGTKWVKAPDKGNDVYVTAHPEEKFKTAKTFKHKVLYEATDKHPAQIEKWEETESVGKYITERWSGMITPAEKSAMLGRLDKLFRAVKKARQQANTVDVIDRAIGQELVDYIIGHSVSV